MNAIDKAVFDIMNQIPNEILQVAMTYTDDEEISSLTSLSFKIITKVIRARVTKDMDIVGGIQMVIPLSDVDMRSAEQLYTTYYIDPRHTMGKEIVSVISLSYMPSTNFYGQAADNSRLGGIINHPAMGGQSPMSAIESVTSRIGSAASPVGILLNANVSIVAYNTVLVYANYRALSNYGLRAVVSNDENLTNLPPRTYLSFSKLCVLAAKAYIYNTLIVPMNNGVLSSGQELGVFKSLVESYEQAEQDYQTYLREVWSPTAFIADHTRYNRFLSSMIAPDL